MHSDTTSHTGSQMIHLAAISDTMINSYNLFKFSTLIAQGNENFWNINTFNEIIIDNNFVHAILLLYTIKLFNLNCYLQLTYAKFIS